MHFTLEDLCELMDGLFSQTEISQMEKLILKTLKWKIHFPTPGEIARALVLNYILPSKFNSEALFKCTDDFIEFCLLGTLSPLKC